MKIIRKIYPDKSFYPLVEFSEKDSTKVESLIYRINSYNDLWFLKQIKDVLDFNKRKCHLTIPCLLDAQADRRFNNNESHNLKLICNFINEMKWESVSIFHPHNQEVAEALIDNVILIDNKQFIDTVLGWIQLSKDYDDEDIKNKLTLLSVDAGGFKPLMKLADKLKWNGEVYSASKSRKWVDNQSKLIQQIDKEDFEGKDILIIDDLCVNGGTFIGLANLLRERNVGKLFLAISHLTVGTPNPELWKSFDQIFTTNSKDLIYCRYFDKEPTNLIVFDLFKNNEQ